MVENVYNKKMEEIESIDSGSFGFGTEWVIVKNREDLRKIIEEPCLPACLSLYDKNIQTINSSANRREIGGFAYIGINYDSLDDVNKGILEELIVGGIMERPRLSNNKDDRGGRDVIVKVPVLEGDTVGIVSDRFLKIIDAFQEQDVLYGRHDAETVLQSILERYSELLHPDEDGCIEFEEVSQIVAVVYPSYYYDAELDVFWETQDLYQKHKRFQEREQGKEEETQK